MIKVIIITLSSVVNIIEIRQLKLSEFHSDFKFFRSVIFKMVVVCGIASCRNRSTKENVVMLHRYQIIIFDKFPADKIRAELWLKVIQSHQPSFNISNQTRICNSHFVETDYTKKKLNKEAIPSIFRPKINN
ncbi:hypothetical protein QTP88_008454 [Uroleucon formosanum]